MSLLRSRGPAKELWRGTRRGRGVVRTGQGRTFSPHRAERRRQVDLLQHAVRPHPPRCRICAPQWPGDHRHETAQHLAPRGGAHLPDHRHLFLHDGDRERPDGPHLACRQKPFDAFPGAAAGAAAGAGTARSGGHGRSGGTGLEHPRLWRPEAPRTGDRPCQRAGAVAHGRTHRRHGAGRARGAHGPGRQHRAPAPHGDACSPSTIWTSSSAMPTGCWCSTAAN